MAETQTIEITNLNGRLTRVLNGDLNSGAAKFTNSWGYDPFSKPFNLTWLEQPVDITGAVSGMPLAAQHRLLAGSETDVYLIDNSNKLYRIKSNTVGNALVDSVVGISSVANGTAFLYGSSLSFFGSIVGGISVDPFLYVSHDNGVNKIMTDGSAEAKVTTAANIFGNQYHPLKRFAGGLYFGNGNTIGEIDGTGTVVSSVIGTGNGSFYSALNPPLPTDSRVQDLDVSIDSNYLKITSSQIPTERLDTVGNDLQEASASDGAISNWNGSDLTVTAETSIPSYGVTAQQTFLGNSMFFSNDALGASVNDGTNKILTLPGNKSPLPNATDVNGNFLLWASPEVVGSTRYVSLYYFGALDQENPSGLFRVMRWATSQANAQVFQVPMVLMVNSKYQTLNTSYAIATIGYGKHYIGFTSVDTSGTYQNFLLRFLITPTGTGTPQLGVYETQTQLFSKKVAIKQVRVYTEPTVTGNGFQVDYIGSDGNPIANGTGTYSFAAGTDITKLQGALTRINFNMNAAPTYALGLRITNTGTTNMTIKKIEVDWQYDGK